MVKPKHSLGFVSLIAIAALALISVAVAVVLQHLQHQVIDFKIEERQIQLTAIADAGCAEVLANLSVNPRYEGAVRHTFGSGFISSHVQTTTSMRRTVQVIAQYNNRTTTIFLNVEIADGQPRVVDWRRTPR